jgi:small subunit ribosomal protein S6
MRDYEVVYVFDSTLDRSVIDQKLERFNGLVAGKNGGEITAVEHWGKRQLAYPIQNHEHGYYVVVQFRAEADRLPEFERVIQIDDNVLRHLVVLSEGELPSPRSAGDGSDERRSKRRRDEDEDDDDEDDEDEDE